MSGGGTSNNEPWTVYSSAQHLPAVLNDPNRGKQANFFTKTWGDQFVERQEVERSPFLPEVTYAHFDQYLRKFGKRHKRHQRLAQGRPEEASNSNTVQKAHKIDAFNIPNIFLRGNFQLNDPQVFATVFPKNEKTENQVQDELSLYLDVVEEQIAVQVSQQSGAFFHAMTSHDTIMEQMGLATNEVRQLRAKVQKVDKTLARDSLKLVGMARSKANHTTLVDKLKLMSTVLQTQPTLQLLLSSSDYVAALELISSTQDVLARELAGVTSLRYLPSQLREMLKLIDKMLTTEFERYAAADLHRPLDAEEGVLEPDRLVSLVAGLLRQNNLQFLDIYKKESEMATKTLLKQLMIEQLADAEDEAEQCLTGSGDVAPSLDAEHWLRVLRLSSETLGKLLQRVKAVHDMIRDTADSACKPSNTTTTSSHLPQSSLEYFLSTEDHARVMVKLKELLCYICDYCNKRLASLVSTQSDKQSISASHISELSTIVDRFTDVCSNISGRHTIAHLKAAFKIQAGNYVKKFHSQRSSKLALLLDSERWQAADVPSEIQLLVDKLASGQVLKSLPSSPKDEEFNNRYNKPEARLKVGHQDFVTIGAVLILTRLITEYCVCAYDIQILAPVLARNLAELLQKFNSRCYQLVLGCKAMETAGLKTINGTNLTLASRSLQLILWMIPHIRGHFQGVGNGHAEPSLNIFDDIERDISNHVQQLEDKVLTIVNTLVGEELNNWDARPPVPSKQFRNISRHLTKLYEAVSSVLPAEQVTDLYQIIHKKFKSRLRDQLVKMNIPNNGGPQHGVVITELVFYLETMRNLKVLSAKHLDDQAMEDIWIR